MPDNDQAYKDEVAPSGSPFRPLYDDRIMFNGQPIGLVVAETSEIARFAASLVRVEYDEEVARHGRLSPARPGRTAEASDKSVRGHVRASEGARRTRAGTRCGRSAPRGRILCSDRASQPDGALRLDGDLRGQRQAHGLRQDPGRAERAEVSVRRVRHEAGRCAGHVAIHGRRIRLGAAPAVSGRAGGARGARAAALGACRADAAADVCAGLPARDDSAHRHWCERRRNARCDHP